MSAIHPATETYLGLPGYIYMWGILLIGTSLFSYIIYKRYCLMAAGQVDPRFNKYAKRFSDLMLFGILQKRQPRYFWAGVGHILIFWGFVVLGLRSMDLVSQGIDLAFLKPVMAGGFGTFYNSLKDIFELGVLFGCMLAVLRRAVGRPKRYEGSHTYEAYLVLALISVLMITDMVFEASAVHFGQYHNGWLPAAQLAAVFLPHADLGSLKTIHLLSYWVHILVFFIMLNLLPLSKHFHIITAIPNVFFRKLKKGSIKPVRWDAADIEDLDTLGVEKLEDFTWKDILDFFSCTECGRCTDNCPANASGRPLSPKMMTLRLREHAYENYPVFSSGHNPEKRDPAAVAGRIISDGEIWSCTTCGACEEECPVFIGYIDKIIDMRRNLIENARNPKSFNKVLMHVEKTGNPFGKPAAKRGAWIKESEDVSAKIMKKGDQTDILYFVDSYGSYDPRVQNIATAIVDGLNMAGVDFGILGSREKDSGHQVRRLGEEGLFEFLVEENVDAFSSITFSRIITTDPHAFNTIKKDYPESYEVFHYSQFFLELIENGRLKPAEALESGDIYTYHDPCYLGRHNGIYDAPRKMLRAIPGIQLVEMEKSRDRSFCCGGGDVTLWHEIEEETRMALMRIHMAKAAGANVVVTACPFCLIHFEDAIKTGGLENEMRVIDLMELFMSSAIDM